MNNTKSYQPKFLFKNQFLCICTSLTQKPQREDTWKRKVESNLGLDQTIKPDAICSHKGGRELQVCTSSSNNQSEQITNSIPKNDQLITGGETTAFIPSLHRGYALFHFTPCSELSIFKHDTKARLAICLHH